MTKTMTLEEKVEQWFIDRNLHEANPVKQFQKLMEEQNLSFPTVLLTGSDTAREKRLAYAKIASGEALVIIGTHARKLFIRK